jgi:hypothetical protein
MFLAYFAKVYETSKRIYHHATNYVSVNEILGDHNVDKQISDSKGDVGINQYQQADANQEITLIGRPGGLPNG